MEGKELNLIQFMAHLAEVSHKLEHGDFKALNHIGAQIAKDAKSYLGEYQSATSHFPAWEPLAPSTIEDKTKQGYPVPSPLLRTGEMRDSISHEVHGKTVVVGSTDQNAVYQELGTGGAHPIPPRSFLGRALYSNVEKAQHEIGMHVVKVIEGKRD